MDVILAGSGIKLIDITVRGEKKNKVVEIFVDSEDFLDLDKISSLSRKFNEELDKVELKSEVLKFVISSPGADRPFLYIWQLKKYLGKVFEFERPLQALHAIHFPDLPSWNMIFQVFDLGISKR